MIPKIKREEEKEKEEMLRLHKDIVDNLFSFADRFSAIKLAATNKQSWKIFQAQIYRSYADSKYFNYLYRTLDGAAISGDLKLFIFYLKTQRASIPLLKYNALSMAALYGHRTICHVLVKELPKDMFKRNIHLLNAARGGHLKICQEFYQQTQNIKYCLLNAILSSNLAVCKFFLQQGPITLREIDLAIERASQFQFTNLYSRLIQYKHKHFH